MPPMPCVDDACNRVGSKECDSLMSQWSASSFFMQEKWKWKAIKKKSNSKNLWFCDEDFMIVTHDNMSSFWFLLFVDKEIFTQPEGLMLDSQFYFVQVCIDSSFTLKDNFWWNRNVIKHHWIIDAENMDRWVCNYMGEDWYLGWEMNCNERGRLSVQWQCDVEISGSCLHPIHLVFLFILMFYRSTSRI